MPTPIKYEERQCEVCDEIKLCSQRTKGMWFCADCWQLELKAQSDNSDNQIPINAEQSLAQYASNPFGNRPKDIPAGGLSTISLNSMIQSSRETDQTIRVRPEIFNAATTSIVDLKNAIDADENITNKPYALAEVLKERYIQFKDIVFELNEKIVEAANQQRAIQVYLNQLANQLRQEERDKLKIADINYAPKPPKIAKPKVIKTKAVKFDKVALRKKAAELGIDMITLQMIATSMNFTIEQAAAHVINLKKQAGQ